MGKIAGSAGEAMASRMTSHRDGKSRESGLRIVHGLEGRTASAIPGCLRISDPEACAGQTIVVVYDGAVELINAVGGDKEFGPIAFDALIVRPGRTDGHCVLQPGTATFFDPETQPGLVGI